MVMFSRRQQTVNEYLAGEESLHRQGLIWGSVLREPAPLAVFEGYTSTSTEFSLRVLLSDINKGLGVQSDLRIAAFEALRAANIDLPRGFEAVQAAS